MKLLTKEILSKLPALGSQENNPDPIVVVKFFDPCGSWTWYMYEGSPEGDDFILFGLVHGFEKEFGTVSLNELSAVRNRLGLGIERDLHWTPCPLSKITSGAAR